MEYELAPPLSIDEYYELRLYRMLPTRLPDFHHLMSTVVPPIFARSGIPRPLAFWESRASRLAPLLAYIIPWKNLDDRMQAWKRFYADPQWKSELAANYDGAQRVERSDIIILRPAPIWARFMETRSADEIGGVHELCFHDLLNENPAKAYDAFAEIDLPFMQAHGARVLGLFSTWFGTRMNQMVSILAWPDAETLLDAHRKHRSDPAIIAARERERHTAGRPLLRGSDMHIMTPLDYGRPHANLKSGT